MSFIHVRELNKLMWKAQAENFPVPKASVSQCCGDIHVPQEILGGVQ